VALKQAAVRKPHIPLAVLITKFIHSFQAQHLQLPLAGMQISWLLPVAEEVEELTIMNIDRVVAALVVSELLQLALLQPEIIPL
jgi:hypothetical protein